MPPSPADLPVVLGSGNQRHPRHVRFHAHDGPELVLVEEGRCRSRIAGTDVALDGHPGVMHVLPAATPHDQRRWGAVRTTYVSFRPGGVAFDDRPRAVPVGLHGMEARWIRDLHALVVNPRPAPPAVSGSLLFALLERLAWREADELADDRLPASLAAAVAYLRAHVLEAIALADVARAARLSVSHLHARFRAHFGCGVIRYQQELRMNLARALLEDPSHTVKEVAYECGYEDANYFTRLFRKLHGCTPGAWRGRAAARGGGGSVTA